MCSFELNYKLFKSNAGSLTHGPTRQARMRSIDPQICEDPNVVVHVFDKFVCENKICLANPKAVCRVDPCGGCRHAFDDPSTERKVDCETGLSKCQREVQTVVELGHLDKTRRAVGRSYQYNLDGYSAPEGDAKVLPDALLSSATVYSSARLRC